MSSAQQRVLVLWAALLSAVVCLGFLPASRLVSVLVLLMVLGLIVVLWYAASRRVKHDICLSLDDLPEATYRQPVVLVCGDLPLAWPHQSPVLTVTQGCWIRVEDHQDLEQVARQIPQLRAMLAMRNLLRDLKSNLLDNATFRKELEKILKDPALSQELRDEMSALAPK